MRVAIRSKELDSQTRLKSRLLVRFSLVCLWRAEASLSGLSAQHSTFIINLPESLPPSRLSQLQLGPCDCCLSHLTLRWLALMSLSTRKSRDRVLIEQKGIMRLPAPGGGTIFKIYMFNSYFILLSGDFGPSFSQGLATFCTAITATCLLILLPFHLGNHTSLQAEQARLPEASHTSLLG